MESIEEYNRSIRSYSEEELEDISRNIDKEKYKDRYELVIEELKKRKVGGIQKKQYPPWSTDTVLEITLGVFLLFFIVDFILGLIVGALGINLGAGSLPYSMYTILRTFILDGVLLYIIYRFLQYYKLPFKKGLCLQRISTEKILWLVIGGVFTGLCVIFLGAFESSSEIPLEKAISTFPSFLAFVFCAISIVPVTEEIFFRGYVYPAIEKERGIIFGLIITAVLFGIIHIPQLWGAWQKVTVIFIIGFVLTLIRALTKSTLASIVFHLTYNISTLVIGALIFFFSN